MGCKPCSHKNMGTSIGINGISTIPSTIVDDTANEYIIGNKTLHRSITVTGTYWKSDGTANSFEVIVQCDGTNAYAEPVVFPFNTTYISGITKTFTAGISGDDISLIITAAGVGENLTFKRRVESRITI